MSQNTRRGHRRLPPRPVRVLVGAALGATLATLIVVSLGLGTGTGSPGSPGSPGTTSGREVQTPQAEADANQPGPTELLDANALRRLAPRDRWTVSRTDENTRGDGLSNACQQERFADPQGYAALVRTLRTEGQPSRSLVQTVEVSKTPAAALRAFRTTQRWYAGCRVARHQLLAAQRITGVGQQAQLLTLRDARRSARTVSVAFARTGRVTTSVVANTPEAAAPTARLMTRVVADAVSRLCSRSGAPVCLRNPTPRPMPVPPSGEQRGLLATVDLPPVGDVAKPWAATRSRPLTVDKATNTCDRARFLASGARGGRTRTYLVPRAALPARFGLTESYGRFTTPEAAQRFLAGVRRSVATCEDRDLATQVGAERRVTGSGLDGSAWDLTTEVSKGRAIRYRIGFARVGRTVAQLTFTPGDRDDMSGTEYDGLVRRAGDRLRELP